MRPFDWRQLLDSRGIHYVERGANVKRGEVNIKCPFCGDADPSQHMGLNLETGWYSCWRNRRQHSGKSPVRLLMALLRIGYNAAREMAGLGESYIDPDGFDAVAARLLNPTHPNAEVRREFITFDKEFLPITERPGTARWWNYLYGRSFDDPSMLCQNYMLLAARTGDYANRLILPYYMDGRLVTWTGRAIGNATIRYKDLSVDDSLVPVKNTLFNFDNSQRGHRGILCVVEGPMDALKIDFYGKRYGVRAVALSTNSMTAEQVALLEELSQQFERVAVVMDNKTGFGDVDSMALMRELAGVRNLQLARLPDGRGDAAEMKPTEAVEWARQLRRA